MHARRFHIRQGHDRTGQFTLDRPLVPGILHQATGAESGILLQDLKTDRVAVRQTLAGKFHPRLLQIGARHHDRACGLIHPIVDTGLLQDLHDLDGILLGQIAE